jgi:hypothetical protein
MTMGYELHRFEAFCITEFVDLLFSAAQDQSYTLQNQPSDNISTAVDRAEG